MITASGVWPRSDKLASGSARAWAPVRPPRALLPTNEDMPVCHATLSLVVSFSSCASCVSDVKGSGSWIVDSGAMSLFIIMYLASLYVPSFPVEVPRAEGMEEHGSIGISRQIRLAPSNEPRGPWDGGAVKDYLACGNV